MTTKARHFNLRLDLTMFEAIAGLARAHERSVGGEIRYAIQRYIISHDGTSPRPDRREESPGC